MESKTPCGLLNELAKRNDIDPVYIPCEEFGPAHQKTFKVKLTLPGYGEYEGNGSSIRDAKNAAANVALNRTISNASTQRLNMSPTVELNILSMKAGEHIYYKEKESFQIKNPLQESQLRNKRMQNKKLNGNPMLHQQFIKIWKFSVTVCGSTFEGQGKSKQDARNDAANNALDSIRSELIRKSSKSVLQNTNSDQSPKGQQDRNQIGQLNELAVMNKLRPEYQVISQSGPPHLMRFKMKCIVGDKETEGEGIGKKAAKLEASKRMIDLLMNSEEIKNKVNSSQDEKGSGSKKEGKPKREKRQKSGKTIDVNFDPVTYLTQLLQLRKEPLAVYTCIGKPDKNQGDFKIEVRVGDNANLVATGMASTKKKAKMHAADNLLKLCGIDREKIKEQIRESENEVKKAYMSAMIGQPRTASNPACIAVEEKPPVQLLHKAPGGPVTSRSNWQCGDLTCLSNAQQLELILNERGVKMLFNDYTKKNDSDQNKTHLAIMTSPPVVFEGTGNSVEESHNDASSKAYAHFAQYELIKPGVRAEKDI